MIKQKTLLLTYDKDSFRGGIAVGTKAAKSQNEDFCGFYKGKVVSAIAIADGLGLSLDAYMAAKIGVENFLKEVASFDSESEEMKLENVTEFWQAATRGIKKYYEDNIERYRDKSNVLETTLITLIELKDKYLISYLGNGSILYIRGDFWHFKNRRWPWCISDLMVGHSILDEDGKEVLYEVLSYKGDVSNVRVLSITKDTYCGEIFVLTTDGISSPDHSKVGRDPEEKLWLEVNTHIETLINSYLIECLQEVSQNKSNCNQILDGMVEKFLNKGMFDDDATVGIFISDKAIEYYLSTNAYR